MNEKKITFRMAKEKDAGLVMTFIRQLSVYEEMEDSVQATEELLRENLFRKKGAEVLFAVVDKKEVGMALYTAGFAGYLGKQMDLPQRKSARHELLPETKSKYA